MTDTKELVTVDDVELKQLSGRKPFKSEWQELSVEFWLKFPIRVRPLKFVPGRNRAEKRRFRALAAMEERGTLTTTKPGRGGGTLGQLRKLYMSLARVGVLKQTGQEEVKK